MTVLLTIIVRKQFILQHQSSQKYGIILNCLIILSLLTVQSVSTKYCMAILLNIILYQKTTFSAVCRRIEWLLCYRNHYIKQIYIHGLHQTVWSGEMTIIRANCLVQRLCEMRHKSFYDRAYKLHCGMIVMFIFANYTTSVSCLLIAELTQQKGGFIILHQLVYTKYLQDVLAHHHLHCTDKL